MELASWLQNQSNDFPILGSESFATFIKVCEEFSEWALDDIGLANRSNSYKVWTCWVKPEQIPTVKDVLSRYTSLKLLAHYYNINIVEKNRVGLYIRLDWEQNKWIMSYGITNNKKLFKVGEFEYKLNVKLPESRILKYVLDEIDDFNPREHLILYNIKQDFIMFNPGYCKRTDPQIIDKEVVISCYELGQWTDQGLVQGQAKEYLDLFKQWVKTQKWWQSVHLIVRPKRDKWIDFVLKLK